MIAPGLALWLLAATGEPRFSSNGVYSVQLIEETKGKCRVEVIRDRMPHFVLPLCVGTVDDLLFVSNDGERLWLLVALPDKTHGKLSSAVVARELDRHGNVLRKRRLSEFIKSREGYRKVRHLTRHFKWLGGVLDVPGKPPYVDEQDRVVFETVEPKTYRLAF